MKSIKIIAMILLVAMLACSLIACQSEKDTGDTGNQIDTTPPPEGDPTEGLVEVTVSFDITNGKTGNNLFREQNYTYRGFDPTVVGIIKYYMTVTEDDYFAIDEDTDMIQSIGDFTAGPGQSWRVLRGTKFVDNKGNELTIKNLLKDENKSILARYTISSHDTVEDGGSFTIVLEGELEE